MVEFITAVILTTVYDPISLMAEVNVNELLLIIGRLFKMVAFVVGLFKINLKMKGHTGGVTLDRVEKFV